MPNRKEPRLEIEEPQSSANSTSEAVTSKPIKFNSEIEQPEVKKAKANEAFVSNEPAAAKHISNEVPSPSQSGSSFKSWLAILLALVALGLLAWQYLQAQQQQASMQVLAGRIQELEIRLSATGEDLSTAGSSFNEKLEESKAEITELWSENDKLWKVAYRTNRPAISALENQTHELDKNLNKIEQRLAASYAASESAVEQSKTLTTSLKRNTDEINVQIKELNQQLAAVNQRLIEVSLNTSTLDQRLRDQDQRNQLAALQKQVTDLSSVSQVLPDDLQSKLAEQQETLASLEASRRQLVSRVTRLMEDVRELQQAQ